MSTFSSPPPLRRPPEPPPHRRSDPPRRRLLTLAARLLDGGRNARGLLHEYLRLRRHVNRRGRNH